tara:strand:- start:4553 stop:5041 length:489 start_codon:yes stop_codon:yes gene_type:complete
MSARKIKRPVACPPAPEQYAPTTRVLLQGDVAEGEIIMIDPRNRNEETRVVAGMTRKRRGYTVGIHNQKLSDLSESALAICIDDSSKSSLVSCQRHGVVNLLLRQGLKNVSYGQYISVNDIHPAWRPNVSPRMLTSLVGQVVSVYHNNPQTGYTSVRVRLTL